MDDLSNLSLSLFLLSSGLVSFFGVNKLLGVIARKKPKEKHPEDAKLPVFLPNHYDAYFVLEPGGKIIYSNPNLKDFFGLNGKQPHLERLASGIKPVESFFSLCAQEGKARFNLGKDIIEGKSYSIPHNSSRALLVSFRKVDFTDFDYHQPLDPRLIKSDESSLKDPRQAITQNNFLDGKAAQLDIWEQNRTHQLQVEHKRSETLLRIMTELSASLDFEQILQRTLEVINEVTGASHATCMVLQPDQKKLRHVATAGYSNPLPPGGMTSKLKMNQGLVGWIMANRKSVLIDDVLEDERWIQLPNSWYHHRSAVGAPIIIGDQLLGVLLLYYPEVGHFSEEQLDLIQAAANQMAVAIKNAELFHLTLEQKEELGKLLTEQRVETSRSQSILEAIADGVLVTDVDSEITLFNHSAEKLLNLNRRDVIGHSIDHFSGLFSGAANAWLDTIKIWMKGSSSSTSLKSFSEQITLDNGTVLSVNLAPVINNKEFLGTVSVFRDITHLIEIDRLKSEFVATVSHELRTPMTSIKGYVDILLMGVAGDLTEQQARFLSVVQQNTGRLTVLVNDLLDLSRIEAGQINLSLQPLNLADIVNDVMEELNQLSITDNKSMHFKVDVPHDLPPITGDPGRVQQILVNLLGNAYHYTPVNGQINLKAQKFGDDIQIDVQDNGIGISPKEQERIFERFYRGDNHMVYATSGTGLGLSIVLKLINMHHGRIWVQSSGIKGEGSTFSFTLPVYDYSKHVIKVTEDYVENIDRGR
jgi:PAS domain S-box-containing protein